MYELTMHTVFSCVNVNFLLSLNWLLLHLQTGSIKFLFSNPLLQAKGLIFRLRSFWFVFQEQDGIAPQMFKSVIGRGHPEFSTGRQQDAQEFFMHLLSTIDRAEVCCVTDMHHYCVA